MMRITIVGSGNIDSVYNSACYLIDDDILIDIPNGTCKTLRKFKISPNNIKYVLITHFHGDHYFDMPFYLLGRTKSEETMKNINIYLDEEGIEKVYNLVKLAFPNSVEKILSTVKINYVTNKSFNIGNYNIEKVLVDHGNLKPSFGYIFENGNIKVGFTGDTNYCENVDYMASICSYLVCDCSLINGDIKHMGIDDIEKLALKYISCKFIISHLSDDTRKELLKRKLKNVIIPNDGDVFEI